MSVIHAAQKGRGHFCVYGPTAAENCVDFYGLCYQRRSCGGQWSVAQAEITWKSMIHAPAGCEGQGSYPCSDTIDCRLTVEKRGRGNIVQLLFVEFKIFTNQTNTNKDQVIIQA